MFQPSAGSDESRNRSTVAALLMTADALLFLDLQAMLREFGVGVTPVNSVREAVAMIYAVGDVGYVLLDVRMPAVADGSLLAALDEWSLHRQGAVALIATSPDDAWVERLRSGAIDDIVPLTADASTWRARLGIMQRSRSMHLELEERRATAQAEMERDPVTDAFSREMMLRLLFRETDRVQRLRGELSLMSFALEGFDLWIEELGRQVCDGLLREVVARAGRTLRSYDLLGRVGQHAFLAALPGCSPANARRLAERMRIEMFDKLFVVRNERGDCAGVELNAVFAVTPSMGRSPLVVLREVEQLLDEARSFRNASLPSPGNCEPPRGAKLANMFLLPVQDSGREGFRWLG
ncbi:GGDEF domain-containing protein [Acidicapsa dinghuensis]|uniref:GGDEF domain-containing protein n=1 Tax=Acidicapsa dinghuensis TaxID=2218256 RepID=A0ABW1EMY1_9BACT|nr:diguanylate cyclase [Acidicapsa dinghuensis]